MKNKIVFILIVLFSIYWFTVQFIIPNTPELITSTHKKSTQLKHDTNQLALLITLRVKPRKANLFYQSPLIHGDALFIDDENLILLSLFTQ